MSKQQGAWFDKVYADHRELWLAVTTMLQLFLKAGLPMSKERQRAMDLDDPETVGLYVLDLNSVGITPDDVMDDGHRVRQSLRFFPSSGELAELMRTLKHKRLPPWRIADPVYVYVKDPLDKKGERGYLAIAPRKEAEARNEKHWDDEYQAQVALGMRKPMKALPRGMTGEEFLQKRLQELTGRMGMPTPRADKTADELKRARKAG